MTQYRFLKALPRPIGMLAIAILAAPLSGQAVAQTAYSADEIVNRFAPQDVGKQGLGKQKAVCFGTEDECQTTATVPASVGAPAAPMDLVVTFERDSFVLRPEAKRNLAEFAKALKSPKLVGLKFEVAGHTDGQGSDDYNQALSEQRAAAVVRFLAEQGVPPGQLIAKGFGRTMPRTANPLDPANRRVETRPVG
ncbi:OmpA family protein [uncultured Alsobacter sp.]|uniref:OmpA family protein n=1 Tax=uncultured Alsobacter sp. TaxID=1748258 RepID=UPI0025DDA121|nr:OmpA family protein [uncultured Alsobacter sp.]